MSERMHPAVEAVCRVLDDYNADMAAMPEWAAEHYDIVGRVRTMIGRCCGAVARAVRPTAEPTVQVPVSLIERIAASSIDNPDEDALIELSHLLSQPTPTAEPVSEKPHAPFCDGWMEDEGDCTCRLTAPPSIECPRCKGYGVDPSVQRAGDKVIDCTRCGGDGEVTEPPRIEDMAPGTTFYAATDEYSPVKYIVRRHNGRTILWSPTLHLAVDPDQIDPSTIRDVTPPGAAQ